MMRYGVICALLAITAIFVGTLVYPQLAPRVEEAVELRVTSPNMPKNGVITAQASRVIAVTLAVRNSGTLPIKGLLAKGQCDCHFKTKLPTTLLPGDEATLELELPTPPAGMSRSEIRIFADGHSDPIQAVSIPIYVPVQAPCWFHRIDRVSGTAVAGQEYSTEILLEAIESDQHSPWINSVKIDPPEFASLSLVRSERRWTDDDMYLIRTYKIRLSTVPSVVGTSEGSVVVMGDMGSVFPERIAVRVSVISPVAVLPSEVDLRLGNVGESARVDVISRLPPKVKIEPRYDKSLVSVTRVEEPATGKHIFEIRASANSAEAAVTPVIFAVDGGHSAVLNVQLRPAREE